jgi:hypothetical protein
MSMLRNAMVSKVKNGTISVGLLCSKKLRRQRTHSANKERDTEVRCYAQTPLTMANEQS